MPQSTIEDDQIGIQFVASPGIPVTSTDNLTDGGVIIVGGCLDFVAAVLSFEWPTIDKANL